MGEGPEPAAAAPDRAGLSFPKVLLGAGIIASVAAALIAMGADPTGALLAFPR